MRQWPIGFMEHSDVARLVSYVEGRGYYTEVEKRAIAAMAECGMPPWIVASKMYTWMSSNQPIDTVAAIAILTWRREHTQQETPAGRYAREAFVRHMREAAGQPSGGTYTFNFSGPGTFTAGPEDFFWRARPQ